MSNPTFNSVDLTTDAARYTIGPRQARIFAQTIPGVNGQYVQPFGTGGRQIVATGILKAAGGSAAAARTAVLALFRAKEAGIDGDTVADFVGTDGATYSECTFHSYTHGTVQVATDLNAYMRVTAVVVQHDPSETAEP